MYVTHPQALGSGTTSELADHAEIIDALYRFGLGQDLQDKQLLGSAFAVDAELDFGPAAAKWGGHSPVMSGRDTIIDTILSLFVTRIATTHVVTNPRILVNGDTAQLTAIVEAQHIPVADPTSHALLKNLYQVRLVRDGSRWVISHVRIENVWYTGDPVAIFSG